MLALIIAGVFAYMNLPISELPNVDFPTLVVNASLPGADPETMATSVATPLEKELSTVSGINSMTSVSSSGSTKIIMQFALSRNIDAAAQDVQSALLQVERKLPPQMSSPPTIHKVNPADSPVLYLALTAKHMPMTKLDNYAENYLSSNLSMIPGVASVNVFGAQQYAVRIHLKPDAMKARGLSFDDVSQAIENINSNQPTGTMQTEGFYHLIKVDAGLNNAKQFSNAIISIKNGAPIRLKDIASVENSTANDKAVTWYNNQKAIVLAIDRQPGTNTVTVVNNVLQHLSQLSKQLPGGAKLNVVYNRATFINSAIHDVEFTLLLAIFLVVLVIYLFFKNIRFTTIAALSVPVSVIATFGVMYLLSFSLDNLSLMALVLAVGFVIDDAIVVLENIIRHVEQGMSKLSASLQGSKEVSFTVVAMTLSLVAVFIPIFFMGGIIGRLFHEFAAVVSLAILFSGFVALTLIPMLCSRLISHTNSSDVEKPSIFNRLFLNCRNGYEASLEWALDHYKTVLIFAGVIVVLTVLLFNLVSKGFIPSQDTGMIFGGIEAPEGITYNDFLNEQNLAKTIIQKNPNVSAVISSVGQGSDASASLNTGRLIIKLKPSQERSESASQIIHQLKKQLKQVAGLKIFLTNPPAIRIGGKSSNSNYQYVLQGMSWTSLEKAANAMEEKLTALPGIDDVDSDLQMNNPELQLHILRKKAATLGVTPNDIESTLYAAYGQEQVSSIMRSDGDYDVIMDVDPKYQANVDSLSNLYLKSSSGSMVPLSDVVRIKQSAGPLSINHYGQLPAITLSFNLEHGYALGDVLSNIQHVSKQVLPSDVSGTFTGSAQKFEQSLLTLPILLGFTVLVIYMVLAILYESFIHPLTILTSLPFAVFGALLCLYIFGQELDIFSFIGLIMLVGITKKNGIIMVDFALDAKRASDLSAKEAIQRACSVRFRPIMMTTVCAIVAALPLALGLGAGGEARQGLVIAVVGGLIFSQLITLYITPVFYIVMDKLTRRSSASKNVLAEQENYIDG
ncbi:efflux RND transporter permease subunit [Candidiatus Paracoxiella cheracis]|uniref:efflux RND transporter permease subunit n=1 Tax=Candidiatus Paracoxiella cheracis TaxID=3405120 RepID=UPI003BF51519